MQPTLICRFKSSTCKTSTEFNISGVGLPLVVLKNQNSPVSSISSGIFFRIRSPHALLFGEGKRCHACSRRHTFGCSKIKDEDKQLKGLDIYHQNQSGIGRLMSNLFRHLAHAALRTMIVTAGQMSYKPLFLCVIGCKFLRR